MKIKKKTAIVLVIAQIAFMAALKGQTNYADILPTDSKSDIIERAARVVPSPKQLEWQKLELTTFLHFGINTFTDREWGDGKESSKLFNPSELDAEQWVKACKAGGMKMIILTAKHHDGFCLWPSEYTEHSVKNSPWKNGKGDVVGELAAACKKHGIKLGIYLSPWDRNSAVYGSEAYNDYFVNQLTELLTHYGDIAEVWFDGANGEGPNGKKQIYDWQRYYRLIRKLQPDAVIAVMGPDVRWVGTESGYGRDTEWSVVPSSLGDQDKIAQKSQQQAGTFRPEVDATAQDLGSREKLYTAQRLVWYPSEVDVSIRPGWFYHQNQDDKVKSVEKLMDIYYSSVGKNSLLLLNIPPDKRGLIHENDVATLKAWNSVIENTFKNNLLKKARIKIKKGTNFKNSSALFDGKLSTACTASGDHAQMVIRIKLDKAHTFDRLCLQEQITKGQHIEEFRLEAKVKGKWQSIAEGTTVGYKRLLRFPETTAQKLRLTLLKARKSTSLSEVGLYKSAN